MRALSWVLTALSVVVGFSAISVSIFGALLARRKRPYAFLIAFYGAYTLQTLMALFEDAVFSGGAALPMRAGLAVETALGIVVVAVAALYQHELFAVKGRRWRDVLVVSAACAAAALYGPLYAAPIETGESGIALGPLEYAAGMLYLLLFAYLLAVGFLGSKRDRPRRELALIWSTLVFGSVGLVESVLSILQYMRNPIVRLVPDDAGLPISGIPHVLMGAVMMYYFGGYILAGRPATESAVPESFLSRYGISPREQEVVALLDRGLSNSEIAEKLFVSLATVKTHVHNIYEKTGAKSRYALSHMIREDRP